jgi:RNA 3'-terminal phosphate cyclase (ATP)
MSLSRAAGKPLRVDRIRAGRERPGLLRQHLTAVLAAAEVGCAEVEGATRVRAGDCHFAVGTAGSGTLVLERTFLPLIERGAEGSAADRRP